MNFSEWEVYFSYNILEKVRYKMSVSPTPRRMGPTQWLSKTAPILLFLMTTLLAWMHLVFQAASTGILFFHGVFLFLFLLNSIALWFKPSRFAQSLPIGIIAMDTLLASLLVAGTGGLASNFWYLLLGYGIGAALWTDSLIAFLPALAALIVFLGSVVLPFVTWLPVLVAINRAIFIGSISWLLTFQKNQGQSQCQNISDSAKKLCQEVEWQFQNFLHTMPDSVIVMNDDFSIRLFGPAAQNYFGYSEEQACALPIEKLISSTYLDMMNYLRTMSISDGAPQTDRFEVNCWRSDGGSFPAELAVSRIRTGDHSQYTIILQDITERKQSEEAFQQANAKLTNWVGELEIRNKESQLLNEMGDMLQACLNPEEAYAAITEIVQQLFPNGSGIIGIHNPLRTLVEVKASWGQVGMSSSELVFPPDECWALRRGRIHTHDPHSGLACHHVHPEMTDGYLCVPMLAQGEALGLLHVRHLPAEHEGLQRVTQLAVTLAEHISLALSNLRLRETLRNQSVRDPLTGLFNRRYMEESFERELARASRSHTSLGVVMLDIDHFKHFNDTFGHAVGDLLLKELGSYAQKSLRSSDIPCRYGGEEFILILPDASLLDTKMRAEQIRTEVSQIHLRNPALSEAAVTISMGIAAYPEHGANSESLIRAADNALYQAKHEGRNRVIVAPIPLTTLISENAT
jgi:diguanylate cyclase (GGDEF)-like protein/PAS domain S-box-containing protein